MASDQIHNRERRLEHLLLTREIEEFLYAEAELLDTRRFTEWLALLADDVRYWMPMRRNVKFGEQDRENTREQQDMNWFDEGKTTLTQHVQQILTGVHWAEEPLSRVCHMVANVQVVQVALPEVTVSCRFLVYRNRLQDETDLFVGKREDVLRQVDGQWKIGRRQLLLDQNVLMAKNLTLLFNGGRCGVPA
jgi:3-phenylpropionate/cinnamic acid dioxygenase small subunit